MIEMPRERWSCCRVCIMGLLRLLSLLSLRLPVREPVFLHCPCDIKRDSEAVLDSRIDCSWADVLRSVVGGIGRWVSAYGSSVLVRLAQHVDGLRIQLEDVAADGKGHIDWGRWCLSVRSFVGGIVGLAS